MALRIFYHRGHPIARFFVVYSQQGRKGGQILQTRHDMINPALVVVLICLVPPQNITRMMHPHFWHCQSTEVGQ